MRHTDQLQEFIDSLIQNSPPQTEQMPVEPKKLPARQIVIKVGRLGKKAQPGFGLRIAQSPAEQPRLPARRIDQPHQYFECGGFPRAVRAEKTEYLPRSNLEVNAIHRSHFLTPEPHTEDLRKLLCLNHEI